MYMQTLSISNSYLIRLSILFNIEIEMTQIRSEVIVGTCIGVPNQVYVGGSGGNKGL
jgi:hypothetical protein